MEIAELETGGTVLTLGASVNLFDKKVTKDIITRLTADINEVDQPQLFATPCHPPPLKKH